MKRFSAIALLLALKCSSASAARNLQGVLPVYEPPAAYNDTVAYNDTIVYKDTMSYNDTVVYPDGFFLNSSFIVYDTFGVMNFTDAPPDVIDYAPLNSNFSVDTPVVYYMTAGNDTVAPSGPIIYEPYNFSTQVLPDAQFFLVDGNFSFPIYSLPMVFMQDSIVQMDSPPMMFSTSPVENMTVAMQAPQFEIQQVNVTETIFQMAPAMGGNDTGSFFTPPDVMMADTMDVPPAPFLVTETNLTTMEANLTMTVESPPILLGGNVETPPMANLTQPVESPLILVAGNVETPPVLVLNVLGSSPGDDSGKTEWFEAIKKNYTGGDLKSCKKRKNIAPATGAKCSSRKAEKTCFFGNQICSVAYPDTACKCSSGKWTCSAVACP